MPPVPRRSRHPRHQLPETATAHDERTPMPVTVKKVIGEVIPGEGYKLVAPDGSERSLHQIDAAMILIAGWDEPGEFSFTLDHGFVYDVTVDRHDAEHPVRGIEDMSLDDLERLRRDLLHVIKEKSRPS